MICSNCGSFNEDDNSYCIECGHDLKNQVENTEKKNDTSLKMFKKTVDDKPRKSANYMLALTVVVLVLFFGRVFTSGIDLGELYSEMNVGIASLLVILLGLFACFFVYSIGIKLRLNIFENTQKYPMNDFYLKVAKIYNMGMSRNIPEQVGFFEVASLTFTNMIPVILLSAFATWNSVWGFPYKFIVELIFALISIIIFVSFLIFPDKVNELLKDDIRTEKGFKNYILLSNIPLLLLMVGTIIHIFF